MKTQNRIWLNTGKTIQTGSLAWHVSFEDENAWLEIRDCNRGITLDFSWCKEPFVAIAKLDRIIAELAAMRIAMIGEE